MSTLVCFALKEEAAPFRKIAAGKPGTSILITGIGRENAGKSVHEFLATNSPKLVLTCGFAGGLNPELKTGDIVFHADQNTEIESALRKTGARAVQFHCAERIAPTVKEKQELWRATGADAVEMESQIIRAICAAQKISSATVRVILDTAGEDLPLDFNLIVNAEQEIDFGKLALTLLKSPGKIPALIRLQKQSKAAAEKLADVLVKVIPL